MVDRAKIEQMVREKLIARMGSGEQGEPPDKEASDFINAQYVRSLPSGAKIIQVKPGALITPSARDVAEEAGMEFVVTVGNISGSTQNNPRAIAIGSDHGGFDMKEDIKKELAAYEFVDLGTHSTESVDYPDPAHAVASMVSRGECSYGIIIDGAGIGSAIVANKVPGIRAAHCHNLFEIKNSKEHNNANILTLGGKVIGIGLATQMVKLWLETPFAGGRHQRRVDKMMAIEKTYLKGS